MFKSSLSASSRLVLAHGGLLTRRRNDALYNVLVSHGPLSTAMQAPGLFSVALSRLSL